MDSVFEKKLDMGQIDRLLQDYKKDVPFRIFLCSPPVFRKGNIMKTLEPLSKNVPIIPLLYLGSYLEMFGKKVFISEARTISKIKKEIESFSPHIVGVTATTSQIEQAFEVAHMVKEIDPHMITVGGGPHMTFRYEDALSRGAFDVVVRGAGEHPLHELSEAHSLTTISGIGFRVGDSIVSSPPRMFSSVDYNTYPPPAYYLLKDLNRYRKNVLLISSSACPFQYSMCASSHMWEMTGFPSTQRR